MNSAAKRHGPWKNAESTSSSARQGPVLDVSSSAPSVLVSMTTIGAALKAFSATTRRPSGNRAVLAGGRLRIDVVPPPVTGSIRHTYKVHRGLVTGGSRAEFFPDARDGRSCRSYPPSPTSWKPERGRQRLVPSSSVRLRQFPECAGLRADDVVATYDRAFTDPQLQGSQALSAFRACARRVARRNRQPTIEFPTSNFADGQLSLLSNLGKTYQGIRFRRLTRSAFREDPHTTGAFEARCLQPPPGRRRRPTVSTRRFLRQTHLCMASTPSTSYPDDSAIIAALSTRRQIDPVNQNHLRPPVARSLTHNPNVQTSFNAPGCHAPQVSCGLT